jgi:hypothetical protein
VDDAGGAPNGGAPDSAVGIGSGTASEKVGTIFDGKNFAEVFEQDVRSAMHEIVICASHLRKNRVTQMQRAFSIARINGARIVVITKPKSTYKLAEQNGIAASIKSLKDFGAVVVETPNEGNQKFAVIDSKTVWYGNVNPLGYVGLEDNIMRFVSEEIATELLATVEDQVEEQVEE